MSHSGYKVAVLGQAGDISSHSAVERVIQFSE